MKWYKFFVTHPQKEDAIRLMQQCDPILQRFGALPCAPPPEGKIIKNEDGTIEIRAYSEMSFRMAKRYLIEQGFTIENEIENE